jgi:hypothetical protein
VDPSGLWPVWIHNRIIDQLSAEFVGMLTSAEIQILKDVSSDQDDPLKGGWNRSRAHEHASSTGDRDDAKAKYEQFLNNTWHEVRLNLLYNERNLAIRGFAKILHAVTDAQSPSHKGFQATPTDPNLIAIHLALESVPGLFPTNRIDAVNYARNAFALMLMLLRQPAVVDTRSVVLQISDGIARIK